MANARACIAGVLAVLAGVSSVLAKSLPRCPSYFERSISHG
jgi:hypothetical protein